MPAFGGDALAEMADAGDVAIGGVELAFTTDSYVVKPLRFPGGSIGELAVNGTVNDLAVSGARPLALSLSLILEEGLAAEDLRAEVDAIARAARAAGVQIVAGDTKVVERGHADGMYICTSGIGQRDPRATALAGGAAPRRPDPALRQHRRARHRDHARARRVRARRVDRVRHALAVAGGRRAARRPSARALRCMRDATRGGVASVLNELARASSVAMIVREGDVPVRAGGGRSGGDPRDRPDVRGERGQAGRVRRAGGGRRGARGAARAWPVASRRPRSARCGRSRPGWCWCRRALAAGG